MMSLTITDEFGIEKDALGDVQIPAEHLWGAQTQRSHVNFPIGVERFRWGRPVIRALGILKKCAALANGELGQLAEDHVDLIVRAAQEVIDGRWDEAAKISLTAYHEDLSLRGCFEARVLTAEQFDSWVRPEEMTHPLRGNL